MHLYSLGISVSELYQYRGCYVASPGHTDLNHYLAGRALSARLHAFTVFSHLHLAALCNGDVLQWFVARVGTGLLNHADYVLALYDFAEDDVFPV